MKRTLLILAGIVSSIFAFAQNNDSIADKKLLPEQIQLKKQIDATKVFTQGGAELNIDSIRSTIGRFYLNQFRHFQDPLAPYFMFMSKDGNLAMGIGGTVRMRGWYDWNGSIITNGFVPYMIDIPKVPEQKTRLGATPAGTCLYFTIISKNSPLGSYMGYIEANFDGYKGVGFKLKKAYVQFKHWTVGYASTTMSDPSASAPTIDGAGPNGEISKTSVLVRYMTTFKNKWVIAASAELPDTQGEDIDDQTKVCTDYVPNVSAFGQYQWDEGYSHVRLSGMVGVMQYMNLLREKKSSVVRWSAQLSGTVKIIPNLSVFTIANVGQGYGSFTGDLSIGNYDLVGRADRPGQLYAPLMFGVSAGVKYNFLHNLFAAVSLGEQHYYPKSSVEDSEYRYGLYGAINVFWNITPRIQVGAEYLAGKRSNFNGEHANANRIDALFQFSF